MVRKKIRKNGYAVSLPNQTPNKRIDRSYNTDAVVEMIITVFSDERARYHLSIHFFANTVVIYPRTASN